MNRHSLKKGFTLIELLVVMSVLSVLIGIGIYTYSSSLSRARDQRRKSDLASIASALESYRANDINGSYPNTTYIGLCTALVPNYMQKLPWDPSGSNPCVPGGTGQTYTYVPTCVNSICNTYVLSTTLESTNTSYSVNQNGEITYLSPLQRPIQMVKKNQDLAYTFF